jgi:hypothetical protein
MIVNTMTVLRPQRKTLAGRGSRVLWRSLRASAALLVALALAGPSVADTLRRPVVDRFSGLAISGYDPVAYFTDGRPLSGSGDFEAELAGAVWRFRNVGNRAAFLERPDVYMPRFGGYDPVGLARGVALPGNPELWLIRDQRLYLFYSADDRDAFVDDGDSLAASADESWPVVERKLPE